MKIRRVYQLPGPLDLTAQGQVVLKQTILPKCCLLKLIQTCMLSPNTQRLTCVNVAIQKEGAHRRLRGCGLQLAEVRQLLEKTRNPPQPPLRLFLVSSEQREEQG